MIHGIIDRAINLVVKYTVAQLCLLCIFVHQFYKKNLINLLSFGVFRGASRRGLVAKGPGGRGEEQLDHAVQPEGELRYPAREAAGSAEVGHAAQELRVYGRDVRPGGAAAHLGLQVGGLLGQVRLRVPVVRRQRGRHVQRHDSPDPARQRRQRALHRQERRGGLHDRQLLPQDIREEDEAALLFPQVHARAPDESRRFCCARLRLPFQDPVPAAVVSIQLWSTSAAQQWNRSGNSMQIILGYQSGRSPLTKTLDFLGSDNAVHVD